MSIQTASDAWDSMPIEFKETCSYADFEKAYLKDFPDTISKNIFYNGKIYYGCMMPVPEIEGSENHTYQLRLTQFEKHLHTLPNAPWNEKLNNGDEVKSQWSDFYESLQSNVKDQMPDSNYQIREWDKNWILIRK